MVTRKRRTSVDAAVRRGRAMPKREFPAHLQTTPQDWRNQKRTEWSEVVQAIRRYSYGSAYCPAGNALYHLQRLADDIDKALAAEWVAW